MTNRILFLSPGAGKGTQGREAGSRSRAAFTLHRASFAAAEVKPAATLGHEAEAVMARGGWSAMPWCGVVRPQMEAHTGGWLLDVSPHVAQPKPSLCCSKNSRQRSIGFCLLEARLMTSWIKNDCLNRGRDDDNEGGDRNAPRCSTRSNGAPDRLLPLHATLGGRRCTGSIDAIAQRGAFLFFFGFGGVFSGVFLKLSPPLWIA